MTQPNEPFYWDDRVNRYRRAGRFIKVKDLLEHRDTFLGRRMDVVNDLAEQLANDQINVQQWVLQMRQEIKRAYMAEYELGIGGRNMMTQADFGRVGGMLKNQYNYLNGFAEDIQQGKLSVAQIQMRGRMYVDSATQSFERANAIARGLPSLPAYPGDGQTVCRSNCKCNWRIEPVEFGWNCYWELGAAEHCPDCVANASRWNPLFVSA